MAKIEDEDFLLGGRGLSVEFCIFCFALRVSCLTIRTYFSLLKKLCHSYNIYIADQFLFALICACTIPYQNFDGFLNVKIAADLACVIKFQSIQEFMNQN